MSIRVREMTEADIAAVSAIRVSGWRAAYAGIVPQTYLDGMSVAADERRRRAGFGQPGGRLDLVAVDARAQTVGWACLGPYRGETPDPGDGDGDVGEVYALYVRPELIGTGVGRALLAEVHDRAGERRLGTLFLWVLRDNLRARRFYEAAGYAADGAVQSDTYPDTCGEVSLPEVRYRRTLRQ